MNPGFGIANAVAPLVGQNMGAGHTDRAGDSAKIGNIVGTSVMAGIGILFLAFPQIFIRIFTNDVEVIQIGKLYLQFLSLTFGFIAFSLVLGKALTGAGDTISPMVITFGAQMGVGLCLVIILSHFFGLVGVWIGIALSNVVQGGAMWFWYRTGNWKRIKTI